MKRIVAFILLVSLLPFSIFYSSYTTSAANDDSDIILGFINDGIKDEIDTPSDNNNTNPSDSPAGDSEDDEMSAPTLPEKGDDLTPTLPEDGEEPTEPEIPTEPETPEEPTTPEEPENSEVDEPSEEEPQEPQTPPARYEILLGLHSGKFDRFES